MVNLTGFVERHYPLKQDIKAEKLESLEIKRSNGTVAN